MGYPARGWKGREKPKRIPKWPNAGPSYVAIEDPYMRGGSVEQSGGMSKGKVVVELGWVWVRVSQQEGTVRQSWVSWEGEKPG